MATIDEALHAAGTLIEPCLLRLKRERRQAGDEENEWGMHRGILSERREKRRRSKLVR